MTIVALVGQKGGSGKTTLTVHLATEWKRRGYRVLIADADPQQSAVEWAAVAEEHGQKGPTVIAVGDSLRKEVLDLAPGFDLVLIDTAGRHSKRSASALLIADVAVLPCLPSPMDLWALESTVELVEQARELRPELAAVIVRNGESRTKVASAMRSALAEAPLPVLDAVLNHRTDYAKAMVFGQGVSTFAPGGLASLEIRRLADELEEVLGIGKDKEGADVA